MKFCLIKELHLLNRAQRFIEQCKETDEMTKENNKQYIEYIEHKRNMLIETAPNDCFQNKCCENLKMKVCCNPKMTKDN